MLLLASGLNFGLRRSTPHFLGVIVGFWVMLVAVGLGLGKLFTHYPLVYSVMKIAGFSYLLYLAYCVARSGDINESESAARPITFFGAALFQWVNPKGWMMTVIYYSSYMPRDASLEALLFASILFTLAGGPCVFLWLWFGSRLEDFLKSHRARRNFNYTMALLLVASMIPALFI